jgi:TonB family protein
LGSAPDVQLQAVAGANAPLEIAGAKAASLKMEGNYDPEGSPAHLINDYVMKLTLHIANRSGQRITGFGAELKNNQENNVFFIYYNAIRIDSSSIQKFEIPFIVVSGDPASLTLEIVGAQWLNGVTWGSFPFPTLRSPANRASSESTLNAIAVDTKPRALNAPRPRYTEEARRDHVLGAVTLRLLIDETGTVQQAKVVNPLPDWLTEEAIRASHELKFEPARKDGKAVPYWVPVVVEFNLK